MALYWPAQTPQRGLFTVEAPKFTMDNWVAINIFEKNTNFHMDLDTMCVDVQDSIYLADEIVNHKCHTRGCSEGFLMADGVEKSTFECQM